MTCRFERAVIESDEEDVIDFLRRASTKRRKIPELSRSPYSRLVWYLLEQWGFTFLTPQQVQETAWCAMKDVEAFGGTVCQSLHKLASLGYYGAHSGNIRRDLINYILTLVNILEEDVISLSIQLNKGRDAGPRFLDYHVIPPHKLFSWLYNTNRYDFDQAMLGGDVSNLHIFWSGVKADDPRRQDNMNLTRPDLHTRGIPLAIFGDKAPCTQRQSLNAKLWSSLLRNTFGMYGVFYTFGVLSKAEIKKLEGFPDTDDEASRWLVWSLLALERGVWPDRFSALLGFIHMNLPLNNASAIGFLIIRWQARRAQCKI